MLQIPPPKALVLDLDGTLIDSEGLALEAWTTSSCALKLPLNSEFFLNLIGLNSDDISSRLRTELRDDTAVEDLLRESWVVYKDLLAQGVPLKSGVKDLLIEAEQYGIPCAVATSSSHETAHQKLHSANIRDHFQAVSTGDQVSKGKPHPQIFLQAAEKLKIDPSSCWAAEDSAVGVEAASRSGMATWMVIDRVQPTHQVRGMAWRVVDSMHEVLEALKEAFKGH